MKVVHRLLDYSRQWRLPHLALFTGNPVVKANGALVMGRGAAKMVRDTYPGIDLRFGQAIKAKPDARVLWLHLDDGQYIGWFKVKHHWQSDADITLINESALVLAHQAQANPHLTFHMNYPGVGNGKLDEERVAPILAGLPDNVWLYR